ncbi:hypothetical protein BD311DRAFT_144092 [Dichomitus squalens]|uniref:Uncharacterized protein n=1 Tax=Dichomitus squalens TaxID=114155 RepID=A0A4Q9M948_9APHY|nr:hypothetical protein BD311DRAFT_144092 [Dichomitus squalens]
MSGKAPPRAPRALLNSLHGSAAAAAATSSSTPPSAPSNSRIGATPPTGPRSLLNGQAGSRGRGGKSYVNGHAGVPTGPASTPPTGPSALKGKQVDIGWSQSGGPSGVGTTKRRRTQQGCTSTGAHRAECKAYCHIIQAQAKCFIFLTAFRQRRWSASSHVTTVESVRASTVESGAPATPAAIRTTSASAPTNY